MKVSQYCSALMLEMFGMFALHKQKSGGKGLTASFGPSS